MNQKTAKLLNTYASITGESRREVKREWLELNSKEREKRRKEMKREIEEDY